MKIWQYDNIPVFEFEKIGTKNSTKVIIYGIFQYYTIDYVIV